MKDRELIFFPIFSAIGLVILSIFTIGYAEQLIFTQTGSLLILFILIVLIYFIPIFFSAALVSAAIERLQGGDPNVKSGISHAAKHIHHIFMWAVIFSIIINTLRLLRCAGHRCWPLAFIAAILRATWMLSTFFVVPVIVSEGHGPITGIRRSANLVQETWGQQVTAYFVFWFFYIIAVVLAVGLAVTATQIISSQYSLQTSLTIGMTVGVMLLIIEIAVIQTLKTIFNAALYIYAMGGHPEGFDLRTLQTAYRDQDE